MWTVENRDELMNTNLFIVVTSGVTTGGQFGVFEGAACRVSRRRSRLENGSASIKLSITSAWYCNL